MFFGGKRRSKAPHDTNNVEVLLVTADEVLEVTEFTPPGAMLAAVMAGDISMSEAASNTGLPVRWFEEQTQRAGVDGTAEMIVTIWRAWNSRRPKQ